VRAITSGPYGRISLAYFEWAGVTSRELIVPWTMIADAGDAAAFAAKLDRIPAWQPRRTSISGAIDFGVDLLSESPYEARRRVIDISGDGSNNEGPPVTAVRDAAVEQGIVINGLPVMADKVNFSGNDVAHLDVYFQNCVIGGPGSFVIAVNDWAEFPTAIRRKLLLEIARRPPAQPARPPVIWRRRRRMTVRLASSSISTPRTGTYTAPRIFNGLPTGRKTGRNGDEVHRLCCKHFGKPCGMESVSICEARFMFKGRHFEASSCYACGGGLSSKSRLT
jgi:hypothetical protein